MPLIDRLESDCQDADSNSPYLSLPIRTEEQARADIAAAQAYRADAWMANRLDQLAREWDEHAKESRTDEYRGVCIDEARMYRKAADAVRGRLMAIAEEEAREINREKERSGEYVHPYVSLEA